MKKTTMENFTRGIRDGIPIMLGYLAVSFTLGIAAKNAGLTAFQAGLSSLLLNASAGGYAAFSAISAGAGYIEAAIMVLVANARYLLMSFALTQKVAPDVPVWKRILMGYDLTDEVFGISISHPGYVPPAYVFGAMTVALPGWSVGTYLGVIVGNLLTMELLSALSVGLYGMFIAVVTPMTKQNRTVLYVVLISMALSMVFHLVPCFAFMSEGLITIMLTVCISLVAAILRPIKEVRE